MSEVKRGHGIVATLLLVFLIIGALALWLTDPFAEQQQFGFLLSAELVAFSMLVYLYYKENPKEINRSWLTTGFVALAILIILGSAAFLGVGGFSRKVLPLSVTIVPGSVTIGVGQAETFNSTVSGGSSPYSYQWFLNNSSASNGTAYVWTFKSSSAGNFTAYLNVTDSLGVEAKSNVASIAVRVPNVNVTFYGGEVSTSVFGWGNSSTSLSSPGPALRFKVGNVVNMTVSNVGTFPHTWALTTTRYYQNATVLFGAQIGTVLSPLQPKGQPGSYGWAVFVVSESGNFYYICQIPGHSDQGMWGTVTVSP